MPNNIEIGKLLLDNKDIGPEELNKLKEKLNKIQVSLAIEQKNNKIKCPPASGKTMQERYG